MNTIRTFLASLCLVLCSASAVADSYQYLTVSGSGSETSFNVSSIKKITFDTADMVLHLSDGTEQRLALSGLEKMSFAGSPSAIAAVSNSEPKTHFAGGVLRAALEPGETVVLYNMKGEKVFSANESGSYDLGGLSRGVYIVKVGKDVRKIINK